MAAAAATSMPWADLMYILFVGMSFALVEMSESQLRAARVPQGMEALNDLCSRNETWRLPLLR